MPVYIVTGASRGLGLEFVKQIFASGNTVFACARHPQGSKELLSMIDNKNVFGIKMDTTDIDSIKAAAKEIEKNAPSGVNVLINNAGISGNKNYNILNTPESDYINVFKTNVCGVTNVTQEFLPLLRKSGQDKIKKIMNISSLHGSISKMQDGNGNGYGSAYCISKAALNMVTKMLSNELAKENFIVYSSTPGWCQTDMGTSKASLRPEDSIKAQLANLDGLTLKDTGIYLEYNGNIAPW
ncbi:4-dihydrotrisporin dehydrogenase [Backusella circina FSU 941]|nr:4-dihydrotrisporin dehydrogenase [Backusella circina FSU 941]